MKWLVVLNYNGAATGARRHLKRVYETDDPYDAVDRTSSEAVRLEMQAKDGKGMGSICITGFHVEDITNAQEG